MMSQDFGSTIVLIGMLLAIGAFLIGDPISTYIGAGVAVIGLPFSVFGKRRRQD